MKIKKIHNLILAITGMILFITLVANIYLKITLSTKDKILFEKQMAELVPNIGKKQTFYTDIFYIRNLDLAPYLYDGEVVEKNILADSEFLISPGFNPDYFAPLDKNLKKISIDLASSKEEFKLLGTRINKLQMYRSFFMSLISYRPSFFEVMVEDNKANRFVMPGLQWNIDTNPALSEYEAKNSLSEELKRFKERLAVFKKNENSSVETKFCASKIVREQNQKSMPMDVDIRMNAAIGSIFSPNEIFIQKLNELKYGDLPLVCYELTFHNMSAFLRATYILPKVVFGYWDK